MYLQICMHSRYVYTYMMIYIQTYKYTYKYTDNQVAAPVSRYRVAETYHMPQVVGHFPQKSHKI